MKYGTRDVELVQEQLQALLLQLGKALAVLHEGVGDDDETLPLILMAANLHAWRIHWQLAVPCGVPEAAE